MTNKTSDTFAFIGFRKAVLGGTIAGGIAIASQLMIGGIYHDWEARNLFDALSQSSHYLGSAAVGGSSTILALMLTMLSIGRNQQVKVQNEFFKRIETIALFSTIAMIAAVIQLQIFSMPISEAQNSNTNIFNYLYYLMIIYVAVVSGLMVSIVLMLKDAVSTIIDEIRSN